MALPSHVLIMILCKPSLEAYRIFKGVMSIAHGAESYPRSTDPQDGNNHAVGEKKHA